MKTMYKDRRDVLLRLPATLKMQLELKAQENGRSLNAEITKACENHVREQYRT